MAPKTRITVRKIGRPNRPMMRSREATYRPFKFAAPKSRIPLKKKVKNDSEDSIAKSDVKKNKGNFSVPENKIVMGEKNVAPSSINTRLAEKSAKLNAESLMLLNESSSNKNTLSSNNGELSLRKKEVNAVSTNNLKLGNIDLLTPAAQKKRISVRKLIDEFPHLAKNVRESKWKKGGANKNVLSKSQKPLSKNISVSHGKEHLENTRDTINNISQINSNTSSAPAEDIYSLPSTKMLSKEKENVTSTIEKNIPQKINIEDSTADAKNISIKTSPCIVKIKAYSSLEENDNVKPMHESKQKKNAEKSNIPAKGNYASSQRALNLCIQPEDSNRNWLEKSQRKRVSSQKESGKKKARAEMDENQTILLWMEGKKKKKAADITDLDVAFAVVKEVFKNFSTVTMNSKTRALLLKYEEVVEKQLLETLKSVISLTTISRNILKITKGINKKSTELGTLTDRKIKLKHKISESK